VSLLPGPLVDRLLIDCAKVTTQPLTLQNSERVIQEDINHPVDAPHLFVQNAKVDEFNQRVHNAASGNKFRINAQDSVIGPTSTELIKKQNTTTNT